MRTPATIALTIALTCATVQTSASSVAAAPLLDDTLTVEVIVRDDVIEGETPSFTVVETDLSGMVDLLSNPAPGTTVEPNASAWITAQPTDPQVVAQWGFAAANFAGAWDHSTGDANITIAVLDTGVTDAANLGDRRLEGISFVDGDPTIDPTGHGTWVAGLAAASHDEVGIAGVCPKCTVLPVQVGDQFGRVPWSAAAAGITWAVDQGADVINLSFGGTTRSQTLADAVAYAIANDVIVVAAAGNNGTTNEFYPAALDGVLAVAGHNSNYDAYSWTNSGPWVDVAAAGCNIGAADGGYSGICGTSFAAPAVAGLAALLLDRHGDLTVNQMEELVERATVPVDYVETGWVDAAAALSSTLTNDLEQQPAEFAPTDSLPFTDVNPGAFYAEPIEWLVSTGATSGTSPTTFSPDDSVTRGQLATFLWRLHGQPDPVSEPIDFADVNPASFYAHAVAWLASTGATTGTTPTTFSPDDIVSRGQLAAFLWRLEGQPALTAPAIAFDDVDPTAYFGAAIAWMAETGVTTGTTETTFSPEDTVTRGQLATFLWRHDRLGE
ncbi:MAG: S8 family serine peptidase [Actinomycetota bacterium]